MEVLYQAERDGVLRQGNRQQIADLVGVCADYVARLARCQTKTKSGWEITRCAGESHRHQMLGVGATYIARKRGDDPILGKTEEIALLLGISVTWARTIIKEGRVWNGWVITEATEQEIAEMEAQWK